ncbi:hypothetical protein [Brevibacillus sp. SYSU BS000544]|uniref:hypothetical protein n=1 Tax=Brevibacillus sp. SYSU BS000544 TaxID=3416443 RepID=UPI003CE5AE99
MRVIYAYNPNNSTEVSLIERVKQELGAQMEEVLVTDFQNIKDVYSIRATPALIIIRDDLQGEHLLEEDLENNQLRVTLECLKSLQEEEQAIFEMDTKRIDAVVKAEVNKQLEIERSKSKAQIDYLGQLSVRARKAGVK